MKPTQFLYYRSLFCTLFFLFAAVTVMGQTATITITNSSIGGSGILNNANYDSGAERVWTQNGVDFGGKAITCNQNNTPAGAAACQYIQAQASNGVIYNTTALPGRIVSIQVVTGGTANSSTAYGGSSGRLVNNTVADYTVTGGTQFGTGSGDQTWTTGTGTNYTYFAIKRGSGVAYFSSIIITYETGSNGSCFSEDFSDIINGNNTTTVGSGTQWAGNTNFPTVVKTYQAGGAVRMGNTTNPGGGSIESRALTEVSGDITVNIMVKGWTTIEGGIKVSIDGQEQSLTYVSTINDPFETVTAIFYGVTAGSKLKIETVGTSPNANQRCFIDSVEIICGGFPKYFISKQDGNWNTSSTWQSSEDGINWNDATTYPGASAESVVILADHTVEINNPAVVITNTTVYGTIEVTTAGAYSVDGDEQIELSIENGGVFLVNSPGSFVIPAGNAFGLVKTGGKLVAGPNMGSGTAFVDAYVGYLYGIFYFGNGGICEWDNSSTVFGSSSPDDMDIFRPYEEDDMPILRIITTPAYSFGNSSVNNVLNCVLEIIEPATFTVRLGASSNPQKTKTIVGGVRGSGKLIMEDNSGPLIIGGNGTYHLDNIIPELGGTATIVTNSTNDRLRFPNGAVVPSGANFTIENNADEVKSFQRIAGTFNINGTLDITNQSITNSNTGGISVNNGGTIRTRHTGGLFGGSSAIPGNIGNLTLNEGSTVDYYATENQTISSGKDYYHIVFSGGGIKTPQNATNVDTNGSITITGNPIVNYTANNLGLTSLNSTNFTMDGGKLIIGTGGNQPRPGGTYNISGGAIEFTGNSVTNIKVGPDYYDVIISGQNITPNGKSLNIQNILSVTPTGEFIIPSTPDYESPDYEPSYVVYALKGVQVESGGELVFKNNAQLMQDATGVINTGNMSVEKQFVFSTERRQYNFLSVPVTNPGRFIRNTIYDPNPLSVQLYNESNYYFYETDGAYTPGKGYAVQESSGTTDQIGRFLGTPNNGTLSFPIVKSNSGFNLAGNPYPSNLNIETVYSDNSSTIDPTIYFWDNRGNTEFVQQGQEYNGDHYAKYNALNHTWQSAATPAGYSVRNPNKIVKAGTGFMVQVIGSQPNGNYNLNFNNLQRTTDNTGPGFFGKGQDHEQQQMDRYWLTMTTPGEIRVMNAVVYFDQGNDDYWLDDTESFEGSDDLYTITDGYKLGIQGRAPFRIDDELRLGYKAFRTGTHIISVYQKEGVFAESQDIWLVDMLLNKTVNLTRKPYKFLTRAGEYENRFKIIYRPSFQTSVDISPNNISMLKVGQQIEISSTIDRISEVEVFDLNSRPVFKKNEINQNKFSLNPNSFNHQILIIKVKTETGETVTRKFVMK